MNKKIGLIDYGMGNLYSVQQTFNRLNHSLKIITKPADLKGCDALILPGVGSFDPAMNNLAKTNLIPFIKNWVNDGKPLLGICLGLQLLFESSEEGSLAGLGLIKGRVCRLPEEPRERIPHMGWALINQVKDCPLLDKSQDQSWMYFVHSYSGVPLENDLAASVSFGQKEITAIVWKDNFGACQFHPEKSGKAGEKIIKRWLQWLRSKNQGSSNLF